MYITVTPRIYPVISEIYTTQSFGAETVYITALFRVAASVDGGMRAAHPHLADIKVASVSDVIAFFYIKISANCKCKLDTCTVEIN